MAQQIKFFEKNKADLSESEVTVTASQGDDYADLARNRSNNSAWMTSGSVDADNTYYEVDFVNEVVIDTIILVEHNFKAYTVQYWNGSAYTNFSTSISETTNTYTTTAHSFTEVTTTKVKLTITGTMVVDDDKYLYQFIATKSLGQFNSWPVIKKPTQSRSRQRTKMLSGKELISEQVGAFSCTLDIKILSDQEDITLIEDLYYANDGFLVWINANDATQFNNTVISYRKKDIYLMKCADEYQPELYKGLYGSGIKVSMDLVEVVD